MLSKNNVLYHVHVFCRFSISELIPLLFYKHSCLNCRILGMATALTSGICISEPPNQLKFCSRSIFLLLVLFIFNYYLALWSSYRALFSSAFIFVFQGLPSGFNSLWCKPVFGWSIGRQFKLVVGTGETLVLLALSPLSSRRSCYLLLLQPCSFFSGLSSAGENIGVID